jgi:hypothetical protein
VADRSSDPTAHDLPTSAELAAVEVALQRTATGGATLTADEAALRVRLVAAVNMIGTVGHGCGLVDPYPAESGSAPLQVVIYELARLHPWLHGEPAWHRAVARVEGRR